jgi:hypothetical protein
MPYPPDNPDPSRREKRRLAILRSDRMALTLLASAVRFTSNMVVLVWLGLLILVMKNDAGDGQTLVGVLAIPVLLFWLLGRVSPRLAAWLTRNYPSV